jgi:hypothetical protein
MPPWPQRQERLWLYPCKRLSVHPPFERESSLKMRHYRCRKDHRWVQIDVRSSALFFAPASFDSGWFRCVFRQPADHVDRPYEGPHEQRRRVEQRCRASLEAEQRCRANLEATYWGFSQCKSEQRCRASLKATYWGFSQCKSTRSTPG